MRSRILAAVAVTAWSKAGATAVLMPAASASSAVADPVVSTCPSGPQYVGAQPTTYGTTVSVQALTSFKGTTVCSPGTLRLQASNDAGHTQWKTIASAHTTETLGGATASHTCLPGTWTYRGQFTTDDLTYKGGTDAGLFVQFTC